jgi:uncharacterized protein YceK
MFPLVTLEHLMAQRPFFVSAAGILAICVALLAGCSYVAEHTAPKKQAATSRSQQALSADELFWSTLHDAKYDQIAPALEAETAAYLSAPNDAIAGAHVGWLHIWRLSERRRLATIPATITDDATLSRKYFQEAVALNPDDARYLGFLASATLAEGSIHKDEAETRRGYYLMLDAIKAYPEFNLFTAGYTMSGQPADSDRYKQALEWQWRNLDVCVGEKVDRKSASYAKYMPQATDKGIKRVCWNSWIAPHNFEGFFLNMGDMQVKSGDWQTGQKLYENAKLSPTYAQWRLSEVLEQRIRDAQQNVAAFNAKADAVNYKPLMAASSFSCVACHQQ